MSNPSIEFIKSIYCSARLVSKETGLSWELILAQAAQETRWGQKVLKGTNNLYNIKADSSWTGEKKIFHVHETIKGKEVWVDDYFRCYKSYDESIRGRIEFLKNNPRYTKAGLFSAPTLGNYKLEAETLQKAGYATDPAYAKNLIEVFEGPTMQKAIQESEKIGCECLKPAHILSIQDFARSPIADTKVRLTISEKTSEATTSKKGEIGVRVPADPTELTIEIWDSVLKEWTKSDKPILLSNKTPQQYTVTFPHFTATATTEPHPLPSKETVSNPGLAAAPNSYQVKKDDTLGAIGKKFGMSYQRIAEANHISSPYKIFLGQTLIIPQKGTQAPIKTKPASTEKVANIGKSSNRTTDLASTLQHPWLTIAEHERILGIRRNGGALSNAHIEEYSTAVSKKSLGNQYAYCAAFASWCLVRAGFPGIKDALASSFKNWGRATKENKPAIGAAAVIRFPPGGYHVTFVIGKTENGRILTLGGNQGSNHSVNRSSVPPGWVVAYRLPKDYPDYDDDYAMQTFPAENEITQASTR